MKDLSKQYKNLSASERASLVVAAMARCDEQEAEQLGGTCPHKTMTGPDLRYGLRLSTIHRAALIYQVQVLTIAMRAAVAVGRIGSCGDHREDDKNLERLNRAMSCIAGFHEAWRIFCSETGFDGGAVLAAYGISFSELEQGVVFDSDEEMRIDAGATATLLGLLRNLWMIVSDHE